MTNAKNRSVRKRKIEKSTLKHRIGVGSIYLILRPKRDMSPRDRIDKICSGEVSERKNYQNVCSF